MAKFHKNVLRKFFKTAKKLVSTQYIDKGKSRGQGDPCVGPMSQSQAEVAAMNLVQNHPKANCAAVASHSPASGSSAIESIYSLWGPDDHFNSWRQNAWRTGPYLREPSRKVKNKTKNVRPELRRVNGGSSPGDTARLVAFRQSDRGSIARANMMTCPSTGPRKRFDYCAGDGSLYNQQVPAEDEYDMGEASCRENSPGNSHGESMTFYGCPECKGLPHRTWQEELKCSEDRKDRARRREYLREMNAYAEIGRARRGTRGRNNWGGYRPDGRNDLPAVAPHIAGHGLRSRDVVRSMLPRKHR